MKKFRLVHSFPRTYHLHHLDKYFENKSRYTIRKSTNPRKLILVYSKFVKNHKEFGYATKTKKLRNFCSYPKVYYMLYFNKWFKNHVKNKVHADEKSSFT